MQTHRHRPKSAQGSVLLIVMCICAIVLVLVGSYLALALFRNNMAAHSAALNQAMPVAEAGIEDALTQLQYSTAPSNGWTHTGTIYWRTRSNPLGDSNSYYSVGFLPTNIPVITATGYVLAPYKLSYISRIVQVTARKGTAFPYGMLAHGTITISGGSSLDSFNSTDPLYSTNGMYVVTRREANVKLASDGTNSNTIAVGTGKVYGSVDTGPGTNTISVGSSGSIGDISWVTNSADGGKAEAAHTNDDMNVNIPDISPPSLTWTNPATLTALGTSTISGTNYTYTLGNNNYEFLSSTTIPGGTSMVVTGAATLYVQGSFTLSGSGFIYIAPGGSLQLYVGTTNGSGNQITLSGGGVVNGTGNATNFTVYGLPSVTTATVSGSAEFIGILEAPDAALTMSGSADAIGAVVANTITLSGGMNFHYDENLSSIGSRIYTVISWREL
jgi:hypothetical protein